MSPSPVEPRVVSSLDRVGSGADRPHLREEAVQALLRDLGLSRGDGAHRTPTGRLLTGLDEIDRLTQGGFPAGRLSEITGPASSGRTSVAHSLLARATQAGEVAAVVDAANAFDPASSQAAGAQLERVLWIRPPSLRAALRSALHLLEAGGFALVLLDLAEVPELLPTASWQRLARACTGTGTALVALSSQRATAAFAELALELQSTRAHFTGTPAMLEGIEIEAVLTRNRTGPDQRSTSIHLRSNAA